MSHSVKFRLEDLPPHLRSQAERQIAADNARRLKSPPSPAPKKHPIRLPKVRFPNDTEARWPAEHPGHWLYEALTFACPSGKYTPDWIRFDESGITAVEVKGSYRFGSQSGATAKFKECVELYPQVRWIWARWNGKKWECEDTGRTITRQTPDGPGDSPHVRPCAGACAREPQELIAAWDEWRGKTCHKCAFKTECDNSLSQISKSICFNAWLHSTKEDGK